jgi:V8-like Glu-specific endopeptidase
MPIPPGQVTPVGVKKTPLGEGAFCALEDRGEVRFVPPLVPGREAAVADPHQEVAAEGTESGEEYSEATAAQWAGAEAAEESAFSDLGEGFESIPSETSTVEAVPLSLLPDAGAAVDSGQQEFLPLLAKVAPVLISTVAPAVTRAIAQKLSPKTRRAVQTRTFQDPLLALLAQLLKQAGQQQAPLGESAAEIDGALADSIAQQIEVIIGDDDRQRITATQKDPWRYICALRIQMPSGATFRGTGFLIGKRTVATAGHCVYLHNQGGWARRIEVIPGSDGVQRPFGSAISSTFRSVNGWTQEKKPECDYGCILLQPGAFGGRKLGNFGFASLESFALMAKRAVLAGYPGDKPFAELWGMGRRIKTATGTRLVYDHDTMGGQSGAPVYVMSEGRRYVVGIHNYGASTGNSATRVTEKVCENLLRWSQFGA